MKAYREDKKRIYLLKTTHQRRDLEAQRFVKPRLKGAVSRNSTVLGYYKMPFKVRET